MDLNSCSLEQQEKINANNNAMIAAFETLANQNAEALCDNFGKVIKKITASEEYTRTVDQRSVERGEALVLIVDEHKAETSRELLRLKEELSSKTGEISETQVVMLLERFEAKTVEIFKAELIKIQENFSKISEFWAIIEKFLGDMDNANSLMALLDKLTTLETRVEKLEATIANGIGLSACDVAVMVSQNNKVLADAIALMMANTNKKLALCVDGRLASLTA